VLLPLPLLSQITGIASTADYLEYLPGADEFRKHAPGCAAAATAAAELGQQALL
jgi:hypothetical protein